MTIPVLVLPGFAGWTVVTLLGTVGIYRWSRIRFGVFFTQIVCMFWMGLIVAFGA